MHRIRGLTAYHRDAILCATVVYAMHLFFAQVPAVAETPVDFDRQIRPILSRACFHCHGPDRKQRKADLRLDIANDHASERIAAMDPENSELLLRITSTDQDYRMPPSKSQLTPEQIALLKKWVVQGAEYRGHWAWKLPTRPDVPKTDATGWSQNAIDHFVQNQLERRQMQASPAADKVTLIRRVSLDVRGLPPSIREVDSFVADAAPGAYETMVDQMLASQHYGERMAQDWLDLSRFGDTNGYHKDSDRDMWLYRDYVINAFNDNKPYNRFVIENLAGDLMPDATDETRIATGFSRNVTFNEEGGADPDEFHVTYAVDRTNTTGQVFLGITFGCAQCHDHKYDPISQREYYQLYAFFNSVKDEVGAGGPMGHHDLPLPPLLEIETPEYLRRVSVAESAIDDAVDRLARETDRFRVERPDFDAEKKRWLARLNGRSKPDVITEGQHEGLVLWLSADDVNGNGVVDRDEEFAPGETIDIWSDRSERERNATAMGAPKYIARAFADQPAIQLDGKNDFLRTQAGGELLAGDFTMVVALKHDALNDHQMMLMWGAEQQGKRRAMWKTADSNYLSFNGHSADVVGKRALTTERPQIAVIMKTGETNTIRMYLDGEAAGDGTAKLVAYTPPAENPITIGANNAGLERTAAQFAEVMIFDRALRDDERQSITDRLTNKYGIQPDWAIPTELVKSIQLTEADQNDEQRAAISHFFMEQIYLPSRERIEKLKTEVTDLSQKLETTRQKLPTTMVMVQKPKPNPAYVLLRGDFQNRGERVERDVPAIFPRLPADQPRNRLGLAHWMTDPQHPLVARVVVNRLWNQMYGVGLVKTLGDLGTQGDQPSHPALLDWLAVEFVESGWDVKHMQKLMLMSSAYRQSSQHSLRYSKVDPDNRYLSRAARFRLSAEEIRDNALSISGLLTRKIGGPSVKPYQPLGYYADKIEHSWEQSKGEDLYRRGVYTYWRRTTVYPSFQIFDAPSREFCTVNRPRTNTPLQALVLLNDPTFVEAARVFGQRIMKVQADSVEERCSFAFRAAVARQPSSEEVAVLSQLFRQQRQHFRQHPDEANKLIAQGEAAREKALNVVDHAAWTALASIILNLDETVTRE